MNQRRFNVWQHACAKPSKHYAFQSLRLHTASEPQARVAHLGTAVFMNAWNAAVSAQTGRNEVSTYVAHNDKASISPTGRTVCALRTGQLVLVQGELLHVNQLPKFCWNGSCQHVRTNVRRVSSHTESKRLCIGPVNALSHICMFCMLVNWPSSVGMLPAHHTRHRSDRYSRSSAQRPSTSRTTQFAVSDPQNFRVGQSSQFRRNRTYASPTPHTTLGGVVVHTLALDV